MTKSDILCHSIVSRVGTGVLIFLLAFGIASTQAQEPGIENLQQTGKTFAAVARAVSPSVVLVQVESRAFMPEPMEFPFPFGEQWPFDDDFFRRFFGDGYPGFPHREAPSEKRHAIGQGSGFVFASEDGVLSDKTYILTNNHVVANAEEVRVKFQDGREFEATITGRDPKSDIAVIEIEASGLPALPMGDSSKLEIGEWVIAIGNPFGLSHTLTVGVVSAKGRSSLGINDYEDFIQTDAAINPGNSGGPLVNLNGEVVGINTAIFSRSGGYMGIGFAIPSNLADTIAKQLIERGEVTRGFLGIVIQPLTPELAKLFAVKQTEGILIAKVSEESPAAQAGLQAGDIIQKYRGETVKSVGAFRNRVALTQPGTRTELVIIRDGQARNLSVTIGNLTSREFAALETVKRAEPLGLTVQAVTNDLAEQLNAEPGKGVAVTAVVPGSVAARAGIEPGTIILQVNRQPVKTAAHFKRAAREVRDDQRVLLLIRKGDIQRYIVLRG